MKKIKMFLCVVAGGLAFVSCGSDDDSGSREVIKLPTKITTTASTETYAFEYDNQNNLKKYTYNFGSDKTEVVFNYTDNKVTQILSTDYVNGSSNFTLVYTVIYEGTSKVRLQSQDNSSIVYNLDANGYVTSEVYDGDTISFTNDSRGNITKVTGSEGDVTQLSYSSYKGIFSGIKSNRWTIHLIDDNGFIAQLSNAVLSSKYTDTDGDVNTVSTYEGFVSEYPTKWNFTESSEADGTESQVYTITYK